MKTGIYIPGLGESFRKESAEKYAAFFMRQLDFDNPDHRPIYKTITDIIEYDSDMKLSCKRTSIIESLNNSEKTVYKFYEYKYGRVITKKFIDNNALIKAWLLLKGVISKFPLLLLRLIYINRNIGYKAKYRGQTILLFVLFLLISAAFVFLLPAAIAIFLNVIKQNDIIIETVELIKKPIKFIPGSINLFELLDSHNCIPTWDGLKKASQIIVNITAIVLLLIPGFNNTIISMACEFVSASNYLNHGESKKRIHGQLDSLMEKIVELEGSDVEICFHTYSFGSLVALDYLFPFSTNPGVRAQQICKGIVTVGCPYDFVAIYFPAFFKNRNLAMKKEIQWINIYSLEDSLASNFRKDTYAGEANYSFSTDALLPVNINYEIANSDMNLISQFFSLYSVRAHTKYWDTEEDASTCLSLVIPKMKELNLL